VRGELDALVPAAVQPKLDEHAIGWFNLLGEGRYQTRAPMLAGSGFSIAPATLVTAPATGSPRATALPRAPGK
jgi:hypothetical protein